MPTLKTYDLFISHAWKYGEEYERLISLLDKAPNFCYRNYSAPKDKPLQNLDSTDVDTKNEIKNAINRKIRPVNAVIVISGMYANNREWMQYEIEKAIQLDKPIIAVKPWGNTKIPTFVSEAANVTVGWQTDSIVGEIRQWAI